jgi:hypothetical protein
MLPLDECERIAHKTNDNTFTVGVALGPCSLPQTLNWNFNIDEDEMEVGMGIHGRPGMKREKLAPADEVADRIVDAILTEMKPAKGPEAAVLVNSLDSTPLMELYILNRRVDRRLKGGRPRAPQRQLLHVARDGGIFNLAVKSSLSVPSAGTSNSWRTCHDSTPCLLSLTGLMCRSSSIISATSRSRDPMRRKDSRFFWG